jgi:uncharacterized YceG family protein
MDIVVVSQYGDSTRAAQTLCETLRANGMRVLWDHFDQARLQNDAALERRIQLAVEQADAMILVLDDAAAFVNSRQRELWHAFARRRPAGMLAVYLMPGVLPQQLPRPLGDHYIVPDGPGAVQHLTQKLVQAARRVEPQVQPAKKKKKGAKVLTVLLGALLVAAVVFAVFALPLDRMGQQPEPTPIPSPQTDPELTRTMRVTLIEGMTVEQMAQQLEEEITAQGGTFSAQTFLTLCNTPQEFSMYAFVQAIADSEKTPQRKYALEGYLFPDTYEIFVHTDERTVIEKMLMRFDEITSQDSFSQALAQSQMTLDDAVTLGSVIQKEGTSESFTKISAVFHNRLAAGMLLQSDVTAQYASGKSALTMTVEDVSIDSPYNTYVYAGLPIGPIANPGEAALLAALQPDAEYVAQGYYYFVLTDPATGVIAYSKTYEEHQAIADQYAHLWAEHDAN